MLITKIMDKIKDIKKERLRKEYSIKEKINDKSLTNESINEKKETIKIILDDIIRKQKAKIVSKNSERINISNSNNKRTNKDIVDEIEHIFTNKMLNFDSTDFSSENKNKFEGVNKLIDNKNIENEQSLSKVKIKEIDECNIINDIIKSTILFLIDELIILIYLLFQRPLSNKESLYKNNISKIALNVTHQFDLSNFYNSQKIRVNKNYYIYSKNYKYINLKNEYKNEIFFSLFNKISSTALLYIILVIDIIIILFREQRREEKRREEKRREEKRREKIVTRGRRRK